jgi:LysM domain
MPVPIGTVSPVVEAGLGGTRPGRGTRTVAGPDDVWIGSEVPLIDVTARLIDKPHVTAPRPKFTTQDRPLRFGLTQYVGHDLYEMALRIKLDNGGSSVEGRIRRLESLAERKPIGGGRLEPPVVKVLGPGIRHQRLKWRITAIDEETERAKYTAGGKDCTLYVATVRLVQHVVDRVLAESLRAVSPANRERGIRNRTITVKAGETSLYDVAKRVYGDPQKAADIANANPGRSLRLGSRLKPGMRLRVP